ncbi:methyltransferase [Candidatus Woesearchaeota archaeon]|nr:methyltransferase [Candidatus Woesearchaeota archaeon]
MLYQPGEDSFLIQKEVEKHSRGRVLEIGVGTGILALTAAQLGRVKSVLGVDIKQEAIDHCAAECKGKKYAKKCRFLKSDLFSKVPKSKFDTIIFNPPYLPEQTGELWELSTNISGGKHGYEIIEKFLADVNDYLEPNGQVLLLFSTITGKHKVEDLITGSMMSWEPLNKQSIMFEQLHVYRIVKTPLRRVLEKKGVREIKSLAKGHRGLVYTGRFRGKKITVKAQREDIDAKDTVDNEVKQLQLLNKYDIGPKLLFSGKGYFAYSFVEGEFILNFFRNPKTKKEDVVWVLQDVFEQMYAMDEEKLNKEEMHHPVKHVLVSKKKGEPVPTLLDFERCKKRPKVHNVTQFAQFVVSGHMLPILDRHKIKISMLDMLKHAKEYSHSKTRENFEKIIDLFDNA